MGYQASPAPRVLLAELLRVIRMILPPAKAWVDQAVRVLIRLKRLTGSGFLPERLMSPRDANTTALWWCGYRTFTRKEAWGSKEWWLMHREDAFLTNEWTPRSTRDHQIWQAWPLAGREDNVLTMHARCDANGSTAGCFASELMPSS